MKQDITHSGNSRLKLAMQELNALFKENYDLSVSDLTKAKKQS